MDKSLFSKAKRGNRSSPSGRGRLLEHWAWAWRSGFPQGRGQQQLQVLVCPVSRHPAGWGMSQGKVQGAGQWRGT